MKRFVGIILMLLLLPALAMAQEAAVMSGGTELIDWTALVVAVIGVIGTALSALLGRVWVKYVKPWLEQRDLTDAAKIVVEAVEALLAFLDDEEPPGTPPEQTEQPPAPVRQASRPAPKAAHAKRPRTSKKSRSAAVR